MFTLFKRTNKYTSKKQGWASVLFKRTQRSLRSFTFFIKELGVLCVFTFFIKERGILLRSFLHSSYVKNVAFFLGLYISICQYIYIYITIYNYIYWEKNAKERNVLRSFTFFCKRMKHSLRSFTFFAKERCVLCILLCS